MTIGVLDKEISIHHDKELSTKLMIEFLENFFFLTTILWTGFTAAIGTDQNPIEVSA